MLEKDIRIFLRHLDRRVHVAERRGENQLVTGARLTQGISARSCGEAGVEAAVFSRNRLDLRVKTRAATSLLAAEN